MRNLIVLVAAFVILSSGCLSGSGSVKDDQDVVKASGKKHDQSGPATPEGQYRFDDNLPQTLVDGPYKGLPFVHQFLQSAIDGVDIEIGYWRPDVPESEKVPVIVDAGPYYYDDGGPMENAGGHLRFLTRNYVPWGYAVAAVAVRGTGLSGGCMDLMGRDEAADLSQAITWLGEQPWSNGNVGMIGKSYDGSTPWIVASTGNPHLKTIVPISGVSDLYELMFRNGTAEARGSLLLNYLYYNMANPVNPGNSGPDPDIIAGMAQDPDTAQKVAQHMVEGNLCPDHVTGYQASVYSGVVGGRDPMGYWAERDLKPLVEQNYKGSIFLVHGLQDWNVDPAMSIPWTDQLNQSGIPVHYMLGEWGHSYPYDGNVESGNKRWDYAQILLNWFDYYLKEKTTVDLGPAAQILESVHRAWHYDDAFPPRDAMWTTYNLAGGHKLSIEPDSNAGSALLVPQAVSDLQGQFRSLPEPVSSAMAADFDLPVGDTPLFISGLPRVHVTVTPQGPSAFLTAYLYDVSPQGEKRIGHTAMNLFFADGTYNMKAPLSPGTPLVAKMQIQPMDALLEPGHTLRLRVWLYRDDAGATGPTDTQQIQGRVPLLPEAPVTLNWGGSVQSTLELPTIERGDDYFFQPPKPAQ